MSTTVVYTVAPDLAALLLSLAVIGWLSLLTAGCFAAYLADRLGPPRRKDDA